MDAHSYHDCLLREYTSLVMGIPSGRQREGRSLSLVTEEERAVTSGYGTAKTGEGTNCKGRRSALLLSNAIGVEVEVRGPISISSAWEPTISVADVDAVEIDLPPSLKGDVGQIAQPQPAAFCRFRRSGGAQLLVEKAKKIPATRPAPIAPKSFRRPPIRLRYSPVLAGASRN
jgi:hypothetical protein